jgi:Ca-activated chloride channel family protein
MSFIWPAMFLALLVIPLIVVWYVRRQQRRRLIAARYGSLGIMQNATGQRLGIRRHVPSVIFLLALVILIIGAARPVSVVNLPRLEGTVILAFDVSGSMAADDLKPSRMDAAKTAAEAFVKQQPLTVQIGVVAFSDGGFSAQAPTNDQGMLLRAISRLAPERGTSLASGIQAALTTIALGSGQTHFYSNPISQGSQTPTPTATPTPVPQGTYTSAAIVLLTDGENNVQPDPLAVAQLAADRGVRIYTIGIGSAAGTDVHINGFSIHTQLDEQTLQQIAQLTGGTYYNADNEQDLLQIYSNLNTQVDTKPQETELTSLFAGAGILVILIGSAFSMLWFSRLP